MSKEIGYIKVQNDLKKKIIQGVFKEGDLLPSENKLSSQYGLSRMTIRNALNILENDGYIYRKQGKGSIVKSKKNSFALLNRKGFSEVMKDKDIPFETVFITKPVLINWRDDFYWNLSDKEQQNQCIFFSRIRNINSKPVMFEKVFIPDIKMEKFISTPFVNDSFFDTLMINHAVELTDVTQKFRAISSGDKVSERLQVKQGSPVLEIIRKLSTNRPGFYIYSFVYCNTDQFTIEI